MKRTILSVFLLIGAIFCAYGQPAQPIDLVLLLDTSSDMASSYDNVNNYITGSFLTEFLRVGDTFHLIAFSANPRLDVARRISARGDVETIIGRMMLQYPVESKSNISVAVNFAEQYITSLPERPKKIVLVSTGSSDTNTVVSAARGRLNSKNTTIDYVQVTPGQAITNVPKSGRPAQQRAGSREQTPGTSTRQGVDREKLNGESTGRSNIDEQSKGAPATDSASSGQQGSGTGTTGTGTVGTTGTGTTGTTSTTGTSTTGTGTVGTTGTGTGTTDTAGTAGTGTVGTTATVGTLGTSSSDTYDSTGSEREYTSEGTSSRGSTDRLSESSGRSFTSSLPFIIGLILLLLLLLGLIIFFASRRLGSSPNRVMAGVASGASGRDISQDRVDHSKDLASYAAGQNRRTTPYADRPKPSAVGQPVVINPNSPLLLNLFVEDQNTHIGKRNIHSLKTGYSLSVGGGRGDGFLIFLVPIPANIGELRRNGSQLSFIPKKPKYFPDIGSNEVRDCLGKTIRIISDKNYELRFRFEMYEDPLIALNRMLNSIKVPG